MLFCPATTERPRSPHALDVTRSVVIGREESATLVIDDPRISRRHAELTVSGGAVPVVRVQDSSANGTYLNGEKVSEATLQDGDVLRAGDTFLLLRFMHPSMEEDADVPALQGRAPSVKRLRHSIRLVAPTGALALILGETGTGKELVAQAIHERSGRSGPFVAVNCGSIPDTLAESQLFGHVAGAFTGAQKAQPGLFRAADGGTLFLDEIGELPLALQPKLLRALENAEVTPVGSTEPVKVDARVVAATHQDLGQAAADGTFRGDLYARLAEFVMRTPTLRERPEDILPLFRHFLNRPEAELDPELVAALLNHRWPYNVRELSKIATELGIRTTEGAVFHVTPVADRLTTNQPRSEPAPRPRRSMDSTMPPAAASAPKSPPPTREELKALLEESEGNVSKIARKTGRSRRQVYRWLEEQGFDPTTFRGDG